MMKLLKIMEDFMKIRFLKVVFSIIILFITLNLFAQDVEVSSWGYGLSTGFGVTEGNSIPDSFSVSFQSWHREGSGWSIDWINKKQIVVGDYLGEYFELAGSQNGLLGSLYFGFPVGEIFRPYIGGGIGIGFHFGETLKKTSD